MNIQDFLDKYSRIDDIVEKCTFMWDYSDKVGTRLLIPFLQFLIDFTGGKDSHSSELKTVLLITKPFEEVSALKESRVKLKTLYQIKITRSYVLKERCSRII